MLRCKLSPAAALFMGMILGGGFFSTRAAVNVTQHHNHATRDGLYVDPAFTTNAAAHLKRDTNFNGTLSGNVYAQPLYLEGRPDGRAMIIAVTESNNVAALDAASGKIIWQDHLGTPVPLSSLACGNIDPLGITGTPVVDLASRALFLDAMTTTNGGATMRHLIFSLNVDTGATNSGWPVDVAAVAKSGTNVFNSAMQNQRGALAVVSNIVYVPYGAHNGDCGTYHGWVVGVSETDPSKVTAWATAAVGGGSWAVAGVASDGINPFIATGNTFGATNWGGGEAVIRLQTGPVFSGLTNDYWAPTNWVALDNGDIDLGGSGVVLVDVPGATPSQLAVALGKDLNAYLLNRTNLGGVSTPVAWAHVTYHSPFIKAPATYRTTQGTYLAGAAGWGFDDITEIVGFQITPSNPPTLVPTWTASLNGTGSPFVTSSDGTNNAIVWGFGAGGGDERLHGYNGDTGAVIFNGGGANELMSGLRGFNTGIAARGRIYVAGDNKVFAFTVPVPPIVLTNSLILSNGAFQGSFVNTPGLSFTVYSTTNLALAFANWTRLGAATEISAGNFQFTDTPVGNQARFYRVSSP
jgi:hypothetical protein